MLGVYQYYGINLEFLDKSLIQKHVKKKCIYKIEKKYIHESLNPNAYYVLILNEAEISVC